MVHMNNGNNALVPVVKTTYSRASEYSLQGVLGHLLMPASKAWLASVALAPAKLWLGLPQVSMSSISGPVVSQTPGPLRLVKLPVDTSTNQALLAGISNTIILRIKCVSRKRLRRVMRMLCDVLGEENSLLVRGYRFPKGHFPRISVNRSPFVNSMSKQQFTKYRYTMLLEVVVADPENVPFVIDFLYRIIPPGISLTVRRVQSVRFGASS